MKLHRKCLHCSKILIQRPMTFKSSYLLWKSWLLKAWGLNYSVKKEEDLKTVRTMIGLVHPLRRHSRYHGRVCV